MFDIAQFLMLFVFIYTVLGLWHMNHIITFNSRTNSPFKFEWWFPLIGWWKVRLGFTILTSIPIWYFLQT